MKLRLFLIPSIFTLAIVFIIISCSKDGPAGATGPAGAVGPAGPAGTPGTAGAGGTKGTANVIYSDWLNVAFQDSGVAGWVAKIPAPDLVDSILSKGEIKVYWNSGSDSADNKQVFPLPISDNFVIGIDMNPYFTKQLITLWATLDVSSYTINGYNYNQFRYILIPGGIKAGRGVKTIDWNDYKQVKAYLGLKD